MIELIKADILRMNPKGFPVPRFAGESELGSDYKDSGVAIWDFPDVTGKSLTVPFSVSGTQARDPGRLATIYARHVIAAAVEALAEMEGEPPTT